jgi:hypothetical protein
MKKLLILALIIFTKSAFAQKDTIGINVPFVNNTVVYERVFDAPNAPGSLLYSNAGLWFAETHSYGGTTKLQLEDPDLLRVAGRANFSTVVPNKVLWQTNYDTYTYNFTLRIDCKDNKYRIRIYNIQDMTGTIYTPVDDMMQSLINSKSLTLATGGVIKKESFKKCFQALNTVIDNVMADINKNIMADNSF